MTESRPYPSAYIIAGALRDGTKLTLRPVRPDDEAAMVRFHERLSEASVRSRYFDQISLAGRTEHPRLARICGTDYDHEMTLVAIRATPEGNEILGVGRLSRDPQRNQAELAVVVADDVQHQGIGTEIVCALISIGRQEGYQRLITHMLPENLAIRRLLTEHGFVLRSDADDLAMVGELTYPDIARPANAG